MGGGGPKNKTRAATTTNIATSNNKALTKANQLYDAGIGGQTYTQSLVPNRAKATTDAYGQIERNARANMGGHGVSGQYQSVINNGGFFGGQRADYDQMRAFSNGNYRTDTSRQSGVHDAAKGSYSESHLGNIANGSVYGDALGVGKEYMDRATVGTDMSGLQSVSKAAHGSNAQKNLSHIATGQYLDRKDPHFERLLAQSMQNASHEVNLGASAAGRYGSAVHQGSVAQEVGNVSSQARLAQYQQERAAQVEANAMLDAQRQANLGMRFNAESAIAGHSQQDQARLLQAAGMSYDQYNTHLANKVAGQMQAASLMDAQRNANLQTRLAASNAITGAQGSDYDRQLSAANQSYAAGQQAYGNLGSAYQGVNMGAQDLISVGQAEEAHAAQVAADQYRIFQEQQNNPWRLVENMNRATAASNSVHGVSGGGGERG